MDIEYAAEYGVEMVTVTPQRVWVMTVPRRHYLLVRLTEELVYWKPLETILPDRAESPQRGVEIIGKHMPLVEQAAARLVEQLGGEIKYFNREGEYVEWAKPHFLSATGRCEGSPA
jgi:hypothetical protein